MPSEARQKKIMEKLNRAQKCSILGPQNLGSGGGPGPRGPPLDPHLAHSHVLRGGPPIWEYLYPALSSCTNLCH